MAFPTEPTDRTLISTRSRTARRGPMATRLRRLGLAVVVMFVLLAVAAFAPAHSRAADALVGPKSRYLGLGDSLAFGYQPNFDWSHGYVPEWYANLQTHGATSQANYGCLGETSATLINGGCPYAFLLHNFYAGAHLNAAVAYIKAHPGQVSPVSLDIGANDLLPDINSSTCAVGSTWTTDLSNLDARLTGTILPTLLSALKNSSGVLTGDLVMMNYYDPYQNVCPNSVSYVQTFNQHLASDAAQFGLPVADVFAAFGGATTPNPNICSYTWMCSSSKDIHATTAGYGVIAGAFEKVTGY